MTTLKSSAVLTAEIRELRAAILARQDGVPNLRDFGHERFAEFCAAVDAYHAETWDMETLFQALGYARNEARAREASERKLP